MLATAVAEDDQVPPGVVLASVVVDPTQTALLPVTGSMTGSACTVNTPALVAVPGAVVTLILPVVAVAGSTAVICVLEFELMAAVTPLKSTDVAF